VSHSVKNDDGHDEYDVHGDLLGDSAKPSRTIVSGVLVIFLVDNCSI